MALAVSWPLPTRFWLRDTVDASKWKLGVRLNYLHDEAEVVVVVEQRPQVVAPGPSVLVTVRVPGQSTAR